MENQPALPQAVAYACYDEYRWLVGSEGRRWLFRAAADERSDVALAAALRRDLPVEPETLRRQLRVAGEEPGVLLLCRQADNVTAIVARRAPP